MLNPSDFTDLFMIFVMIRAEPFVVLMRGLYYSMFYYFFFASTQTRLYYVSGQAHDPFAKVAGHTLIYGSSARKSFKTSRTVIV
jgi:hypothetical protein